MDDLFPLGEGDFMTFAEMVNFSLKDLSVKRQVSHMLQVSSDINESLLCSKSCWNQSSVDPPPLTISPHSIALTSAEETAEFKVERHCEVMPLKS